MAVQGQEDNTDERISETKVLYNYTEVGSVIVNGVDYFQNDEIIIPNFKNEKCDIQSIRIICKSENIRVTNELLRDEDVQYLVDKSCIVQVRSIDNRKIENINIKQMSYFVTFERTNKLENFNKIHKSNNTDNLDKTTQTHNKKIYATGEKQSTTEVTSRINYIELNSTFLTQLGNETSTTEYFTDYKNQDTQISPDNLIKMASKPKSESAVEITTNYDNITETNTMNRTKTTRELEHEIKNSETLAVKSMTEVYDAMSTTEGRYGGSTHDSTTYLKNETKYVKLFNDTNTPDNSKVVYETKYIYVLCVMLGIMNLTIIMIMISIAYYYKLIEKNRYNYIMTALNCNYEHYGEVNLTEL